MGKDRVVAVLDAEVLGAAVLGAVVLDAAMLDAPRGRALPQPHTTHLHLSHTFSLSHLQCPAGLAKHAGRKKRRRWRFLASVSSDISEGFDIILPTINTSQPCRSTPMSVTFSSLLVSSLADGLHQQLVTRAVPSVGLFGWAHLFAVKFPLTQLAFSFVLP